MEFVKIIPRSRSAWGEIKVSFSGSKIVYANIYLRLEFIEMIGWEKDCRVYVYHDKINPKKIMIEMASTKKDSFKMMSKDRTSKITFRFNAQEVKKEDRKLRPVSFEINDGVIIIDLNRSKKK